MNIDEIIKLFTDASSTLFVTFFFKAFAILFAFLYLLYAIVIVRQTQEMNQTFTTRYAPLLFSISLLHIIGAVILILVSLFVI